MPSSDLVMIGSPSPLGDSSFLERCRRIHASQSGGFLYSRVVSDRAGTVIAAISQPLGVHPTILTFANLLVGLAGSVVVTLGASAHAVSVSGLVGLILWQLAYCFDCADGQLARATGKATPGGAFLDPLVDVFVQTSVLVAVTSVMTHFRHAPISLVVIFVATWWINFLVFLFKKNVDSTVPSLLPSRSFVVDVVKLVRDYGFLALVLGGWVTFAPRTLLYPILAVTAANVVLLVGSIARAAQMSIRATQKYVPIPPESQRP